MWLVLRRLTFLNSPFVTSTNCKHIRMRWRWKRRNRRSTQLEMTNDSELAMPNVPKKCPGPWPSRPPLTSKWGLPSWSTLATPSIKSLQSGGPHHHTAQGSPTSQKIPVLPGQLITTDLTLRRPHLKGPPTPFIPETRRRGDLGNCSDPVH